MYSYFSNKNHDESVYGMVPPSKSKECRYVSQFSCKVRHDFYKNRKGQVGIMGRKMTCNSPNTFLRKHTRCSPTFHDETQEAVCDENDYPPCKNDANNKPAWKKDFCQGRQNRSQFQSGYNGPVEYIDRGCPDFVHRNAVNAVRSLPNCVPTRKVIDSRNGHQSYLERPYVLKKGFGRVPAYIHKRKCEQYEKDMQLKRDIGEACAKECREVGPEERRCIIAGLEQKQSEVTKEYFRLPISSNNARVQKQRNDMEIQLENISKDLALFRGSKKIFVSTKGNSCNLY